VNYLIINGMDRLLDDVGWRILHELQIDARISLAELGRRVGLSSPAVAERVRKLEEAGIITGYHAAIDLSKVGQPIGAIILLGNLGDRSDQVLAVASEMPEIVECHRVTGNESYVMKVAVPSVEDLERVIRQIEPYGRTTTALILSSPITQRVVGPPEER
jgi:Lrp/AsnC family leucine-responsive transcriptional regulator